MLALGLRVPVLPGHCIPLASLLQPLCKLVKRSAAAALSSGWIKSGVCIRNAAVLGSLLGDRGRTCAAARPGAGDWGFLPSPDLDPFLARLTWPYFHPFQTILAPFPNFSRLYRSRPPMAQSTIF